MSIKKPHVLYFVTSSEGRVPKILPFFPPVFDITDKEVSFGNGKKRTYIHIYVGKRTVTDNFEGCVALLVATPQ